MMYHEKRDRWNIHRRRRRHGCRRHHHGSEDHPGISLPRGESHPMVAP